MADMQPISSEDIARAEADAGQAFISDRFRLDQTSGATPAANYTFAGICAIIAFIAFAIALVIVIQDWQFLTHA